MAREMAHDLALAPPRPLIAPWLLETAFVALLLFAFVGFEPFAVRDPLVLARGESGVTGTGDLVRQICYLTAFVIILTAAVERRGLGAFAAVPLTMALLLAWCVASALWAPDAAVTFRRASLAVIIVLSTLLSVDVLGAPRTLHLWRGVLIALLLVNWVSVFTVPNAVHQANEIDQRLVGDWRGIYFQKNIAGSCAAFSAIVFFFFALETRRKLDIFLCLAAVGFLIGTSSKSSMALLPVSLLLGLGYRWAVQNSLNRTYFALFLALFAVLAATTVALQYDAISALLSDPSSFTGRAEIWHAEAAHIADHPLLGSGFGSFADTGARSPLHPYISSPWIEAVAHGHNGYLQLLVTIGGVGFALAMLALIVLPGTAFFRRDAVPAGSKALFFTLFAFVILHNLFESDYLEGDGVAWVTFLLTLALFNVSRADAALWRRA